MLNTIMNVMGLVVVLAPLLLLILLGIRSLLGNPLSETAIGWLLPATLGIGLFAGLGMLGMMLFLGTRHVPIELGNWVAIPRYHCSIKLTYDRLSVPFVILSFLLCGTIGAFANRYMHREPGFNRFYVLLNIFVLGMVVTSLAGTIETLFAGWELVGLSSALLVGFFHDRAAPVRNGLRVWIVYRISDASLLMASVVMHHLRGQGDFDKLLGNEPWPMSAAVVSPEQAFWIGLLLLLAAAGKSALFPFCGWLPRAMEGPTPSSAVFYGALSVHLGAFLLLRISPLLDLSPALGWLTVAIGLATAGFAWFAGRVQTDIKSSLSLASLTQVGLIVAEIGFGFRYLPLVHILGHGCLRTLQFVRAPSLLYDYRNLENAIGTRLPRLTTFGLSLLPVSAQAWLYRFALEKGYIEAILADYCVTPYLRLFRMFDRLERRWTDLLSNADGQHPGHVYADVADMDLGHLEPLAAGKQDGSDQP